MKKKSLALAVIAVMMVASLATALTLAYFTDSAEKENVFTVGNVDITLTEPSWPTGENPTKKADPGVAVTKDPIVTNTGANNAYVRVDVVVSDAAAFTKTDNTPYALFTANTGWTLAAGPQKVGDTWVYTYTYDSILNATDPDSATNALFNSVTLPATFTNANVAALGADGFTVTVKAYAIQADSFTTATDAFSALASSLAG